MQMMLSALLSGLELSETKHASPTPSTVSVLAPVCSKFVANLAANHMHFRSYKPLCLWHTLPLLMMKKNTTDAEKKKLMQNMVEVTNHAVAFFCSAGSRELHACVRARRYFPSLNLGPLGRLAAYHKAQMLSIFGPFIKVLHLHSEMLIFDQVLAAAHADNSPSTHCLIRRLQLQSDDDDDGDDDDDDDEDEDDDDDDE
jgi:hypothetical protein